MTQYTHLNQTERNIIANMSASGHRLKAIAEAIGRNKSSISRELQRNRSKRGYRPKRAQTLRALNSRNAKRISSDIFNVATQYLNDEWSPEQIAAALPISHTTIYSRVRADKNQGGQLYKQLRCAKKRRKAYGKSYSTRGKYPTDATSANDLPALRPVKSWDTGKVIQSLAHITNKPSSHWWSA